MELLVAEFEITRPAWLAALGALSLVVLYWHRSLAGFSRARQAASLACRALLILAVVLALCGIRFTTASRQKFVVVALDTSASVAEPSRQAADAFLRSLREAAGSDRVAHLPFALLPGAVEQDGESGPAELDPQGTNVAAAIEAARAAVPADYLPHVVLVSDGVQTEGDALGAARAAGVPISTVPLEPRADPEVYVSAVDVPARVRAGEPFHVEVLLQSSHEDEGTVSLFREGRPADQVLTKVPRGAGRVRFLQSVTDEPAATLTARIEGFRDTIAENNSGGAVVFPVPRPRVLLVESDLDSARPLAAALRGEQIDVDVRQPNEIPDAPAGLRQYGLLVLSNVPAASLSNRQVEAMHRYVGDFGGGLIAVGGNRAFTPGGYRGTSLEEILPVWSQFDEKPDRPALALVLVIDRSGSMEEGGAIELAKEASRRAVGLLEPEDQVGIIAFQDYSQWIAEIRPCSDKQLVLRRINTITAGGGTNMYPAMERAFLALRESPAEIKHMIVLTDGVSHPADFDHLAQEIARSGISVSTVAVGREAVRPLLEDIARIGGGHHYDCRTVESVPQVFALETASLSKMGIVEKPFRARVARAFPALAGLDFEAAPPLLGYVGTRLKPAGELVLASDRGDPVLAWWRFGRGVAVAFTSDAQSRWAAAWLRWPGFGRFWAALARHAMRRDPAEDFLFRVDRRAGRATVTLEAVDTEGRFLNGAEGTLTVTDPAGTNRQHTLSQVAPGRYAAGFSAATLGTYHLELRLSRKGELLYVARRGLVAAFPEELRTRPADRELLRAIAEATGGIYEPEPAAVLAPSRKAIPRTTLLWPYLLTAGAILFVVDVALRRVRRHEKQRASRAPSASKSECNAVNRRRVPLLA